MRYHIYHKQFSLNIDAEREDILKQVCKMLPGDTEIIVSMDDGEVEIIKLSDIYNLN